jgi:hypothetical protein
MAASMGARELWIKEKRTRHPFPEIETQIVDRLTSLVSMNIIEKPRNDTGELVSA